MNLLDTIIDAKTRQSSILSNNNDRYGPSHAIDGMDNYDIDHCNCCSVTDNKNKSSWWQIDLRNKYIVDRLKIYGRGDTSK